MLSLGTDLIFKKAGEVKHDYSKLTAAVSGTYKFNGIHSVRLNYNLSNLSPEVMYLNPYNTSTDSLEVTRGNPFLMPLYRTPRYKRTDRCSLAKTSVCYESEKSDEGCLKKYIGHVIAPRIGFSCKIHCNVLLQGHNFRSALQPNIHSNRSWLPTKRRFPVRP